MSQITSNNHPSSCLSCLCSLLASKGGKLHSFGPSTCRTTPQNELLSIDMIYTILYGILLGWTTPDCNSSLLHSRRLLDPSPDSRWSGWMERLRSTPKTRVGVNRWLTCPLTLPILGVRAPLAWQFWLRRPCSRQTKPYPRELV